MKQSCCRSFPRCSSCPVVAAAAMRARAKEAGKPGALIAEILIGSPARPLPPAVAAALESLEEARFRRTPAPPLGHPVSGGAAVLSDG